VEPEIKALQKDYDMKETEKLLLVRCNRELEEKIEQKNVQNENIKLELKEIEGANLITQDNINILQKELRAEDINSREL